MDKKEIYEEAPQLSRVNINENNIKNIINSLSLKENFKNFYFEVPFEFEIEKSEIMKDFYTYYQLKIDHMFGKTVRNFDFGVFSKDIESSNCEPAQYLRNHFLMVEKMENFLKLKEYLI